MPVGVCVAERVREVAVRVREDCVRLSTDGLREREPEALKVEVSAYE